jgi:hypothetical protein
MPFFNSLFFCSTDSIEKFDVSDVSMVSPFKSSAQSSAFAGFNVSS